MTNDSTSGLHCFYSRKTWMGKLVSGDPLGSSSEINGYEKERFRKRMRCEVEEGRKNMGLFVRMVGMRSLSCLSRFEWRPSASVPSFINIISIVFWGGCLGL